MVAAMTHGNLLRTLAAAALVAAAVSSVMAQQSPAATPDTLAQAPSQAGGQAVAQDTTAAITANISSITGGAFYVNAGRADGLVEGMEVSVIRKDSVVSTLRVTFVSSHQASCEVVRGANDVLIGETVRFYPLLMTTAFAGAARKKPRRLSGPGLHGRLGARYMQTTTDPGGTGFNQPSGDLRVDGQQLGGTQLGVQVDVRTRRTTSSAPGQVSNVDGHTKVYQAQLMWGQPGAGFRAAAGRQYLSAVTSVSLFDGGLVETNSAHVLFGAFGGFEPDANLAVTDSVHDFGGYLQLHNAPGSRTSLSWTLGAVGSYVQNGDPNREFAFTQLSLSTRYLSFYVLEEGDHYGADKQALGEAPFSLTSTYLSGSIRPARAIQFTGSYDDRRQVRLYRDYANPETSFDDSYREGYGGGIALFGHRVRATGDYHHSSGGTSGSNESVTATAGIDRLTSLRLSLLGRGTWISSTTDQATGSTTVDGYLYSLRLGVDPLEPLHFDVDAGIRKDATLNAGSSQPESKWYGVSVDLSVARAWFLSGQAVREEGDNNTSSTQFYGSLSWRF